MQVRGGEPVVAWGDPSLSGSEEAGGFVLPVGTVAFLLTDIEGSTPLWQAEPDAMAAAMERHDAILDAAVSAHGGVCPPAQGEGDSIVAAFARPSDAVLAALDAQTALAAEPWPTSTPPRVRIAVHAGEARTVDDGNYAGQAIIRTARLRAVAHGGQVLVSAPARDLTIDQLGDRVAFRDLGEHRLRDLARPERVYQLEGPGLPDDFGALASLDAHPHNLPVQLSTFIGRTEETATVAGLLGSHRLVTIAGAGGAGKTRLAQHAAAEVLDRFADGVWWVELVEVTDPAIIAATVSTAVGVKGEIGDGAATALAERLGDRHALVVLDNCEHLIAPVAALVDEVLRHCPHISVLTTSREPLEVAGEVAWRIPPLGLPNDPERMSISALPQFESVRLFLDRAHSVRPNFRLSDDNGPAIAALCTRLDGIPLAIELAAARVRSLSPERILAGLTDVFHLLTGGGRTALPRQQTLEASIAWSHDLLAPDEQVLLRRLAVFNGGCTLDDAELVLADEDLDAGEILDLLDRLIAQSLVHLDDTKAVPRYRLLETVRQYATHRLDDAGEGDTFRLRHAERFIDVAEEIGAALEGPDDFPAYARAADEGDNLAAALDTLAGAGRWDDHARLVLGVSHARVITAPLQGIRDLTTALAHAPDGSPLAARLLATRSASHVFNFDGTATVADAHACFPLAEAHGDDRSLGRAKIALGFVMAWVDNDAADVMLTEGIEHARRASDAFGEALGTVVWAASALIMRGEMREGWKRYALADEATRLLGNRFIGLVDMRPMGLCTHGRFPEALAALRASEESLAELAGVTRLPVSYLLRNCFAGNLIVFVQVWCGIAGLHPIELDEFASVVATARAEGQHMTSIMVGIIVGGGRLFAGDLEGATADLMSVSELADAIGLAGFKSLSDTFAAVSLDERGDPARARALLAASEATERGTLYRAARCHCESGIFALADGEVAEAERRAHECLTLVRAHDYGWEGTWALELLAQVAAISSAPIEAVRLAGGAARVRDERSIHFGFPSELERVAAMLASCRATLGDDAYEVAWAEGYALSLDETIEYAQRSRGERKRPAVGWESLTPTELLVIEQIEAGLSNPEIAEKLLISRDTVKTHLSHIFTKLGVKSRSELAVAAARRRT